MTHPIKAAVSIETTDTKGFFYNPRHYKYHEVKIDTPPHMKAGLTYTASGYGYRIPTQYMILKNSKWRRVYACCFSNVSTLYIGPSLEHGHIVEIGFDKPSEAQREAYNRICDSIVNATIEAELPARKGK